MKKEKFKNVGGQALIEGVMMRGTKFYSSAVRDTEGKIVYRKNQIKEKANKLFKVPFLRGVLMLGETLFIGLKELSFSAKVSGVEEGEKELSKFSITMMIIVSFLIATAVFFLFPAFVGSFAKTTIMQNIIEGIIRISLFVIYVYVISFFKDVKRVFQYHGAEHKTIYTYENGEELTVKNAKKYSTLHPRCGTSFVILVLVISILVFSVIDFTFIHTKVFLIKNLMKFVIRIVCLPIIAGSAYELLRYTSNHLKNPIVKIIAAPGLWIQKLTTNEPDDSQLEVAIVALKASLGEEIPEEMACEVK